MKGRILMEYIKKEATKNDMISIIIPCYNEESSVGLFYSEFFSAVYPLNETVDFELIFVDDGSSDLTLKKIQMLAYNDKRVRYISFSKNFGKEAAMYAGLKAASGDYVAIMDVDLQDPPELIKDMYYILKNEDYDCAAAKRGNRAGEPKIRSFLSDMFYKIINIISNTEFVSGARDYRLMTRAMVDSVLELKEYNRFSKGIFGWVGYKTKWISYENIQRSVGETKWSIGKLMSYSLDGIIAFSTKPLAISSFLGIISILLAAVLITAIIVKTLVFGDPVAGYPSLVCIILMFSGLILFSIGIMGQYLSRIYLEVKHRPVYIIKESNTSISKDSGILKDTYK